MQIYVIHVVDSNICYGKSAALIFEKDKFK